MHAKWIEKKNRRSWKFSKSPPAEIYWNNWNCLEYPGINWYIPDWSRWIHFFLQTRIPPPPVVGFVGSLFNFPTRSASLRFPGAFARNCSGQASQKVLKCEWRCGSTNKLLYMPKQVICFNHIWPREASIYFCNCPKGWKNDWLFCFFWGLKDSKQQQFWTISRKTHK